MVVCAPYAPAPRRLVRYYRPMECSRSEMVVILRFSIKSICNLHLERFACTNTEVLHMIAWHASALYVQPWTFSIPHDCMC